MASKFFALIGQDTVWGIGTDRKSTIVEARKWANFEHAEWDLLAEDGRTGDPRDESTFQIVECSPAFAAKVQAHGGAGWSWRIVDGVAVLKDEPAQSYDLFFVGLDAAGNEPNGGGSITVESMDEATALCMKFEADGEMFDANERKVAKVTSRGTYNWL